MAKTKSIEQLIREKTDRLESIPDAMLSKLERLQKEIFPVVVDLISTLQRDSDGFILFNKTNLAISENIRSQLRAALLNSEYVEIVADFADEFDVQASITDEYLKKAFPEFVAGGIASDIVKNSKKTAIEIFINGITDEAFADAISKQITLAVNNNASFQETFKTIRQLVVGDDQVDGKIQQYAQQVAHDQFALADPDSVQLQLLNVPRIRVSLSTLLDSLHSFLGIERLLQIKQIQKKSTGHKSRV